MNTYRFCYSVDGVKTMLPLYVIVKADNKDKGVVEPKRKSVKPTSSCRWVIPLKFTKIKISVVILEPISTLQNIFYHLGII